LPVISYLGLIKGETPLPKIFSQLPEVIERTLIEIDKLQDIIPQRYNSA